MQNSIQDISVEMLPTVATETPTYTPVAISVEVIEATRLYWREKKREKRGGVRPVGRPRKQCCEHCGK